MSWTVTILPASPADELTTIKNAAIAEVWRTLAHLKMSSFLSSSGARIQGDEYQHLVAWIQVVRACLPYSNVVKIGIGKNEMCVVEEERMKCFFILVFFEET